MNQILLERDTMSVQVPLNTAYGLSQALLQVAAPTVVSRRNPTTNDRGQYGQNWVNKTTGICFVMTSISANSYTWYATAAAAAAYTAAGLVTAGTGLRATTGAGNPGAKGLLVDLGGAGITGVVDITGATNITGATAITGVLTQTGALNVTGAITATTSIAATTTVSSGTTMTCGTGLTVTAGGIGVTAGNITATLGNVHLVNGNITVDAGNITATLGDITATDGDITAVLGDIIATQGDITITTATHGLNLPGPIKIITGAGAPAGALAAEVGDMYINTTAATALTRIYVATAAGAWTNITCAA